ncbi:MAG: sugar ABC transporter substrate-binding protein, partial [Candidatus Acidiferrales bacterium]
MNCWGKYKRWLVVAVGVTALGLLALNPSQAQAKKFKIFLNLGYSGNAWQSEAANIVKALVATPPYNKMIDFKEIISGTSVPAQISTIQSMVAAGANGILIYPLSPTALNRAIDQACKKGVLVFAYDGTVTAPCAYDVSYITAGFGENTAQALVNMLQGKGNIFLSRGVPGTSTDLRHYEGAMNVFKKYPEIHIVDTYYGMWDDQITQTETAKALAAHPNVDGIWAQAGEDGAIKALLATGRKRLIAITGENSNGFRLALANPAYQARGLRGVSSGSPPAVSGYSLKLMMGLLTHKLVLKTHRILYPLPWVPGNEVKICKGDRFVNGCNAFPASKVPDSFVTEVFNPVLVPETSLESALTGKPTPGETIQPLPSKVTPAPATPGINCTDCKAAPDLY